MHRAPLFLNLAAICFLFTAAHAQTVNELNTQGTAAYTAKHYTEAATLYRKAAAAAPDDATRATIEYNLACSEALDNKPNDAFATLDDMLQLGFTNRRQTEADSDFTFLHDDPRWLQLLDRMDTATMAQTKRWGAAAFKTPYAPNLTDAEKLAGLAELWAQAKYSFANFWHVPNLDWDKAYLDYIPQVTATKSTADYYRVLERFYALLQDGHTAVWLPKEITEGRAPLATALVDGHVLITGARDGGDIQGLQPGDEILAINSKPVIAYATENVMPYQPASSPQDRDSRTYTRELLTGPVGSNFTLEVQAPTGKHSTHIFTIAAPWNYAPGKLFDFCMLPGNIAYVALNGFDDNTAADEWDKHWPEISKASSLILDLRENGGGDDSVGDHILATLLNEPVVTPRAEATRWIATFRAWGQSQTPLLLPSEFMPPDPAHHFSGPVVMLTSARTYSAAEDMVVLFATSHRGRIMGEPTGGSTGQPLLFPLPGGGTGRICTKHDSLPDGRDFVGSGIIPDIATHNTRADLIASQDHVLETAVKTLRSAH